MTTATQTRKVKSTRRGTRGDGTGGGQTPRTPAATSLGAMGRYGDHEGADYSTEGMARMAGADLALIVRRWSWLRPEHRDAIAALVESTPGMKIDGADAAATAIPSVCRMHFRHEAETRTWRREVGRDETAGRGLIDGSGAVVIPDSLWPSHRRLLVNAGVLVVETCEVDGVERVAVYHGGGWRSALADDGDIDRKAPEDEVGDLLRDGWVGALADALADGGPDFAHVAGSLERR